MASERAEKSKPVYKRILLKLSGEALMGDGKYGISPKTLTSIANDVKDAVDLGVQVAVAGLRDCVSQQYNNTPRPVWNPDIDNPIDFYENWIPVPSEGTYDNAFKVQWELFLRHVALNEPFPWNLLEGAKGVQLAEKGLESWQRRCWLDIPELPLFTAAGRAPRGPQV